MYISKTDAISETFKRCEREGISIYDAR